MFVTLSSIRLRKPLHKRETTPFIGSRETGVTGFVVLPTHLLVNRKKPECFSTFGAAGRCSKLPPLWTG